MATEVVAIDTRPVDLRAAVAIETAEARAWADMYAAAPADWAASAGVGSREVGGALVLSWAATRAALLEPRDRPRRRRGRARGCDRRDPGRLQRGGGQDV